MKNYEKTILNGLYEINEKAIELKNTKDAELHKAENTYKSQALERARASIEENYTSAIRALTSKERAYLSTLNTAIRRQVSEIATKNLTDEEITDMEFIKAYGIKKMQNNPILFNMYLEKHGKSFPFRTLLASDGVNLDNTSIPLTEIDNLFQSCEYYLTNIETCDTYAQSLDSAVTLDTRVGSISRNGYYIDNFINTYTEG